MKLQEKWEKISETNRKEIVFFLKKLRKKIMDSFLLFEKEKKFEKTAWDYSEEGGGEMGLLKGDVFEKAAVNFSSIQGNSFPMQDGEGKFFATGISLITHMKNPHAPTVHMNLRFIETEKASWFGGGYDLTPMGFFYEEDKEHFHDLARKTLDPFGKELYLEFSEEAKKYFFIPHRKKERGVGGIFFDHLNSGNFDDDFLLWKSIGENFLEAILPIYEKRVYQSYTVEDKEIQLKFRGHYVEFNLVYDRGTKFGFQSGGNTEAILCSLPPLASW